MVKLQKVSGSTAASGPHEAALLAVTFGDRSLHRGRDVSTRRGPARSPRPLSPRELPSPEIVSKKRQSPIENPIEVPARHGMAHERPGLLEQVVRLTRRRKVDLEALSAQWLRSRRRAWRGRSRFSCQRLRGLREGQSSNNRRSGWPRRARGQKLLDLPFGPVLRGLEELEVVLRGQMRREQREAREVEPGTHAPRERL